MGLLLRALIAFLILPGTVAFAAPLLLIRADNEPFANPGGMLPLAIGGALLLWCVKEFYSAGKGTLAPWSPPAQLVTSGPYRFSRNPMYIAVTLILIGWAWGFRSRGLGVYAGAVLVLFHLRVVFFEEPWQARTFGARWARYKSGVPRWLWRV